MPQRNEGPDADRIVVGLDGFRNRQRNAEPLSTGDGGGTFDPMEARVTALEQGFKTIDGKLDAILASLAAGRLDNEKRFGTVESRLGVVDAKLDARATSEAVVKIGADLAQRVQSVEKDLGAKATAVDVGSLKGAVDKLPTTWQIMGPMAALIFATLAGVAGLAFALAKLFVPGH